MFLNSSNIVTRRVSCHRQIYIREVWGSGHPIVRQDSQGQSSREPMVWGGVTELQPSRIQHRVPGGVCLVEGTDYRRESGGRAIGQAGEGFRRVWGAFVEEQVPGRGFLQHGRSVTLVIHTLSGECGQERWRCDLQEACECVVRGHLFSSCLEEGSWARCQEVRDLISHNVHREVLFPTSAKFAPNFVTYFWTWHYQLTFCCFFVRFLNKLNKLLLLLPYDAIWFSISLDEFWPRVVVFSWQDHAECHVNVTFGAFEVKCETLRYILRRYFSSFRCLIWASLILLMLTPARLPASLLLFNVICLLILDLFISTFQYLLLTVYKGERKCI